MWEGCWFKTSCYCLPLNSSSHVLTICSDCSHTHPSLRLASPAPSSAVSRVLCRQVWGQSLTIASRMHNHVWKCSLVALVVKNPFTNAGDLRDLGSIPGWGRSHGGGHGSSLQYSCLENPMDRGAWWATIYRVSKSRTRLNRLRTQHYCVLQSQLRITITTQANNPREKTAV